MKTALKLAMFGENNALMHLCAMALKTLYVLKSTHPLSYHINYLADLQDPRFEFGEGSKVKVKIIHTFAEIDSIFVIYDDHFFFFLLYKALTSAQQESARNAGLVCTDFSYETDEAVTDLQMSNSSQFHLSNLLLLTLTEKTIKEKKCMPLW